MHSVQVSRNEFYFDNIACEIMIENKYVSAWTVPEALFNFFRNGSIDKSAKRIWRPEDVSIEFDPQGCQIDIGDECVHYTAYKVYFEGYGLFYPYAIDDVIDLLNSNSEFIALSNALAQMDIPDTTLSICEGDTGKVISKSGHRFPIFAEQSM